MQEQKSMVSERKLAHAVGGKSVRACDNCVKKRVRWYCAADDAFLCDSCDSSVHSANPLARRHERVRLKISSSKRKEEINKEEETSSFPFEFDDELIGVDVPSWQKGFTRKARTPRQKKSNFPTHIVPEQEACSEDDNDNDNEEQLLYRVPVFDAEKNYGENGNFTQDEVNDFLPSELDLAEFAADVESLLGKGLEDEAFDMEGLGIFDCGSGSGDIDHRDDVDQGKDFCLRNNISSIKDEKYYEENLLQFDDLGRETFELNFDCGVSPIMCECECEEEQEEEEEEKKAQVQTINNALLKLDYDRVMSSWDYRKSPWMTGQRPDFNSGDWWPDYYSGRSGIMHAYKGDVAMAGGAGGGREARVSRYREKRRTRLFSKKIRYEVRKLNAEKRPRMKGRFVKRSASFAATAAFP